MTSDRTPQLCRACTSSSSHRSSICTRSAPLAAISLDTAYEPESRLTRHASWCYGGV